MKMKKVICDALLAILNSNWLNPTPAKYAFVGNIDNFSRGALESEESQHPGITVRQLINEVDAFKSCPLNPNHGLAVLEDGEWREGDLWDVHELKSSLSIN